VLWCYCAPFAASEASNYQPRVPDRDAHDWHDPGMITVRGTRAPRLLNDFFFETKRVGVSPHFGGRAGGSRRHLPFTPGERERSGPLRNTHHRSSAMLACCNPGPDLVQSEHGSTPPRATASCSFCSTSTYHRIGLSTSSKKGLSHSCLLRQRESARLQVRRNIAIPLPASHQRVACSHTSAQALHVWDEDMRVRMLTAMQQAEQPGGSWWLTMMTRIAAWTVT
jgi:hypothetical protein